MRKNKLVPVEPDRNMQSAASQLFARNPKATPTDYYKAMLAAAPDVQGEPVAVVDAADDGMWADILPDVTVKVGQTLYAAPQPAEQQPAPDVAARRSHELP